MNFKWEWNYLMRSTSSPSRNRVSKHRERARGFFFFGLFVCFLLFFYWRWNLFDWEETTTPWKIFLERRLIYIQKWIWKSKFNPLVVLNNAVNTYSLSISKQTRGNNVWFWNFCSQNLRQRNLLSHL
jgi:hypothetical protein